MKYQLVKNSAWKEVEVNGEMVEIPEDWGYLTLKQLSKIITGNTPSTTNTSFWDDTGTPWFSTPDFKNHKGGYLLTSKKNLTNSGVEASRLCPKDTLLVSCIATIGEVGLLSEPSCFNQQINAILPNDKFSSKYLFYVFKTKKEELTRRAPKSVVPIIKKSLFENFEVVNPPLPEQTAIAHILSTQESIVSHYDTLIGLHEKRLAYLSDELLSGRLRLEEDATGVRVVKHNEWQEVEVNGKMVEIPVGWSKSKLRSVIDTYIGGDYGDAEASADTSPVEVYTMHAFNQNYHKAIVTRHLKTSKLSNRLINDGDILLEKSGGSPNNPVGRVFQQEGTPLQPRTAVNFITILKLVPTINKKYIYKVLCQLYKNGITKKYEQKTTGIANLKTEQFLEYETLMPNDINEQTLIATMLSQQESLIAHYKTLRDAEQKRFNWLSDALLSGTYRVKELP